MLKAIRSNLNKRLFDINNKNKSFSKGKLTRNDYLSRTTSIRFNKVKMAAH